MNLCFSLITASNRANSCCFATQTRIHKNAPVMAFASIEIDGIVLYKFAPAFDVDINHSYNIMRASLAFNYICEHIDEINIILFDDCISIRADIMRFYKLYPHRINACYLSQNPYAVEILKANKHLINKYAVSINKAICEIYQPDDPIFTTNSHDFSWRCLSSNIGAIPILERHQDKIIWYELSENTAAIGLIERNLDKVNWDIFIRNPCIVKLIKTNSCARKYITPHIYRNPSIKEIINVDLPHDEWNLLNVNSGAVDLLVDNPKLINWKNLAYNPAAGRVVCALGVVPPEEFWSGVGIHSDERLVAAFPERFNVETRIRYQCSWVLDCAWSCRVFSRAIRAHLLAIYMHPNRIARYYPHGYDILSI